MAVMTHRAAKADRTELTPVRDAKIFIDSSQISNYAVDRVEAINRAGIIDVTNTVILTLSNIVQFKPRGQA